jgi:hypothetical protein
MSENQAETSSGNIDRYRLDVLMDLHTLFISQLQPQIEVAASTEYDLEPRIDADKNVTWVIGDACCIGLLIMEGKRIGFWPTHDLDFQGISYTEAAKRFRCMPDPRGYSVKVPSGKSYCLQQRSMPKKPFMDLIDCIEGRHLGLSIDNFKERTRSPKYVY